MGVGEISGAYQAIVANTRLTIEMMEHQHPLAQAAGADFETRPIGRE